MDTRVASDRQGIQSIEVGFRLLRVLSAANCPMMLRDIAKGAGMPAAKAHRYMVSFMRIGIVEQDSLIYAMTQAATPWISASPASGVLTQSALQDQSWRTCARKFRKLVALAVWGNHGATIIRIVDAGGPITITLRAGTVLPLCKSATGKAFAAFFRSPFLKRMLDDELRDMSESGKTAITTIRRQFEKALTSTRQRTLLWATGSLTPGINGFSAPVFDHTGAMVAAITSLGSVGEFNVEWDSPLAKAMLVAADNLSRRLGHGEH